MRALLAGISVVLVSAVLACCHQNTSTAAAAPETTAVTKPAPRPPTSAKGKPCSSSAACASGEHCSTEDGVCNRPPDCKPGEMCAEVCYGTCVAAKPTLSTCRTDADCKTVSVYCDGCRCEAALEGAPKPICQGKPTACLVDPCGKQSAACKQGRCFLN